MKSDLVKVYGKLDPKIAPVVQLLRENGFNTFTSCQGGFRHDFREPTVRIVPRDADDMREEMDEIAEVLGRAGYGGYYIKSVHAYQHELWLTDNDRLHFIEVEFWAQSCLGVRA